MFCHGRLGRMQAPRRDGMRERDGLGKERTADSRLNHDRNDGEGIQAIEQGG